MNTTIIEDHLDKARAIACSAEIDHLVAAFRILVDEIELEREKRPVGKPLAETFAQDREKKIQKLREVFNRINANHTVTEALCNHSRVSVLAEDLQEAHEIVRTL